MTTQKPSILVEFGLAVRKRRLALNLSQEDLGEKSGLHRTYIGMIERGEKNISLINVYKISNALGCQVEELFQNE